MSGTAMRSGSAGVPGEPCPLGERLLEGGHGNQLGAGLAVHVDEHREDELDAVPLDRGGEFFRSVRCHAPLSTCG
jgi:hypothetical protein